MRRGNKKSPAPAATGTRHKANKSSYIVAQIGGKSNAGIRNQGGRREASARACVLRELRTV
nr:MAG TPA: hypothetical protein [Bacteriophage sp.]